MLFCTICGDPFPWHRACDQGHPGLCHTCFTLNLAGNTYDSREHLAPASLVLSPREVQALVAYRAYVRQRQEDADDGV